MEGGGGGGLGGGVQWGERAGRDVEGGGEGVSRNVLKHRVKSTYNSSDITRRTGGPVNCTLKKGTSLSGFGGDI